MGGQPGDGQDQADQRGGVLGEYRAQRGIGGGHDVLDEVAMQRLGLRHGLADRPQERRPLQPEGDGQHDVSHDEVIRRAGARSSLTPWVIDTAPPATNSPSAANSDHT